ncbi:MAG: ferrochelatase [Neisseriaceae bacterium]
MNEHNKVNLVLLVNLGSPDRLSKASIKEFLRKFLSDKRVVNLPKIVWYPILYGIILMFRPRVLLCKYREVWNEFYHSILKQLDNKCKKSEEIVTNINLESNLYANNLDIKEYISPIKYYTFEQAKQLNNVINNENILVRCAFSYSSPEIISVLDEVSSNYHIATLQVIPLYPQYSSTTTASVFDAVSNYYKTKKFIPNLQFCNGFASNKLYIEAVASKVQSSFRQNGRGEKLIFSYHSIPLALCKNGDTYYNECLLTTKLIAQKLAIDDSQYIMTFQSKFGSNKWLTPATIDIIRDLACNGVKAIDIVCPGFVSDCLETLEEIAITNKEVFLNNGGVTYNYIPCLNNDSAFINVLKDLIVI